MVFDLRYSGKRDLHDLAICDLDFYAGSGEGLGGFHAANCATHAPAVGRNNLHIILTIKGLESRECLSDFHNSILRGRFELCFRYCPLWGRKSIDGVECNRKTLFGV